MRRAVVIGVLAAVLVGAGAYQTRLKEWPQVVVIIVGCLPILGHFLKQERAFRRSWLLFFTLTTLAAAHQGCELVDRMLFSGEGIIVVDGQRRVVMTYGWVWPLLAAFLATPVVVWAYARFSGRPKPLELGFATAALIMLCTVFAVYEL